MIYGLPRSVTTVIATNLKTPKAKRWTNYIWCAHSADRRNTLKSRRRTYREQTRRSSGGPRARASRCSGTMWSRQWPTKAGRATRHWFNDVRDRISTWLRKRDTRHVKDNAGKKHPDGCRNTAKKVARRYTLFLMEIARTGAVRRRYALNKAKRQTSRDSR